jgi:uncharacterized protein (TIGR00269 family)
MNIKQKVETKVKQTLKKVKLSKNKRILVALSGGKDSTAVAYILHKLGYKLIGFHIDLGLGKYSEKCLDKIRLLCGDLKIELHIYNVKKEMGSSMCYLRSAIQAKKKGLKNCAICGVLKKWILNREARKFKPDYIATGHNLDDEVQTFLLNILKGSPKLSSNSGVVTRNLSDKKFIPRLKPLFYVAEDDVRSYVKFMKLPYHPESCPCALDSYRIQLRKFLEKTPTKEKENIIKNFDSMFPRLEKLKDSELNFCSKCGEPSRRKICKKCDLLNI